MTALGQVAILAWIILAIVLFRRHPGHRLVIGIYVVGVLFLPEFGGADSIEGVPRPLSMAGVKLTKENAIAIGLVVGSLLFDLRCWFTARPKWFDLSMLGWCLSPVISAVTNSLLYHDPVSRHVPVATGVVGGTISLLDSSDLYDGLLMTIAKSLTWGVPYCLGRLYITDSKKLSELVFCVVAAVGEIFYWPCYHAYFSVVGDAEHRAHRGARRK